MIRQPIITVLGHVDHGKTSLLDSIRSSRVASREAGKITQHIGATEIPLDAIKKVAGTLIQKFGFDLKIPGLLVIDTPGHEAFTNLRKRGGSIADLAILVIDATQGIQPQTKEAIDILRANKVPFIVAMNKIDLFNFYSSKEGSFLANLANQNENTKRLLDEKLYTLVGKLHENGFASERFDRCTFGKEIPIVPCSAHTKEGLPEIITLLAGLSQKYLEKDLEIGDTENARGAVLEAKEEKGLGKTIDVILYQGKLKVNDNIAVIGRNGIIQTKIRALLQPKPMQEMMDTKESFSSVKEVAAACGVKIAAPNLDEVLVGSTLMNIKTGNEISELKKEIQETQFVSDKIGVIVKADAIGSLEAVVNLLRKDGITIKKAEIGNVSRKDVMEATAIQCENTLLGCVIAFNVAIEKDAIIEAESRDIKIFADKVIYKIIEDYKTWVSDSKKASKEQDMSTLTWPCEIEVMRGKVFRNNKPAIFGARIITGKIREGSRVMNKDAEIIGKVSGMQDNGKTLKEVQTNAEVAMAITEGNFGKNLFEGEHLYSFIPANQCNDIEKYKDDFSNGESELFIKIKKMESKIEVEGE